MRKRVAVIAFVILGCVAIAWLYAMNQVTAPATPFALPEESLDPEGRNAAAPRETDANPGTGDGGPAPVVGNGETRSGPPSSSDAVPPDGVPFVIEGQVVADQGTTLIGTDVRIYPFRRTLFTHEALQLIGEVDEAENPLVHVVTDSSGYFQALVPTAGEFLVVAWHPGYSTALEAPIRLTRREPRTFIFFTLGPGASIAGVVRDAAGDPRPGVPVCLLEKLEGGGSRAYHTHRTLSGAGGAFLFEGLEPRRYVLMAKPDGMGGVLNPEVTAPQEGIELRLRAENRIEGRAIDAKSGDPVEGVLITGLNRHSYDQTRSGEDGRFELLLAGADADLLVRHPGYLIVERRIDLTEIAESGETLALVLEQGTTVSGRVRYPDGTAVPDLTLGLQQPVGLFDDIRSSKTDASGRFSLAPVDPSQNVVILAKMKGWALPLTSFSGTTAGGDLVLEPTVTLEGAVFDDADRPLRDVWIRLRPGGADWQQRALGWLRPEHETWSSAGGAFSIPDVVPAPNYVLEISHAEKASRRFQLESFPTQPLGILLQEGGELAGRLLAPEGMADHPLVVLEYEGAPPVKRRPRSGVLEGGQRILAREDGSFYLDRVPAGEVTLHVQAATFPPQSTTVVIEPGRLTEVDISLRRGNTLKVIVLDAEGERYPGQLVLLRIPGGRTRTGHTGSDGTYTFEGLPDGSLQVFVNRPQGASHTVRFRKRDQDETAERTVRAEN